MTLEDKEELSVIARTEETYISFSIKVPIRTYFDKRGKEKTSKHELRFLDSMNFMTSSLDALSKTLEQEDLRILRSGFQHLNDNDFRKIAKKAYLPYSYLDSHEKFNAPFPVFGMGWRNTLTGKIDISEQQFNEAMQIYELLDCNDFGDYHDA